MFISRLHGIVSNYLYWVKLPTGGIKDVIEMIVIYIGVYYILNWVRATRAWTLIKGLFVIVIFVLVAYFLQMNAIVWIAAKALNVGILAILVVFQPELRTALEQLGMRKFLRFFSLFDTANTGERFTEKTLADIVRACYEMGAVKTGALIVIEGEVPLGEYIRTGIDVDALVSAQLLINIFEKNTPLHDGAVIVRGDRVVSATCYLPLSDSLIISKELGTRHRAALGVSEVSDSFTIIVSEETGAVSVAMNGKIERDVTPEQLEIFLGNFRNPNGPQPKTPKMKLKKIRRTKNEENIS